MYNHRMSREQLTAIQLETLRELQTQNELLRSIIDSGSFQDWLKSQPQLTAEDSAKLESKLDITTGYGTDFQEFLETHNSQVVHQMMIIQESLKKIQFLLNDFNMSCEGYVARRKEINNPTILKFIEDYEKYKEEQNAV